MRGFSYVGSSGQSAALPARRNHLQKDGREFIASMLEELGCETLTARSATDALGQLARDEGIDMLFADVNMPGLSGRELAERLSSVSSPRQSLTAPSSLLGLRSASATTKAEPP
jgi:CheY-like chemotaxis protein